MDVAHTLPIFIHTHTHTHAHTHTHPHTHAHTHTLLRCELVALRCTLSVSYGPVTPSSVCVLRMIVLGTVI